MPRERNTLEQNEYAKQGDVHRTALYAMSGKRKRHSQDKGV